ncbi:PAS domain-containing sensor histidine kinase [Thiorhodovibrio frisius]|uniref:histidine kinase n=1 Tax=Thiorhodovibrio frisius TaxID=631362 RepID=H8Z519_9GAMM|nr:PAS domain-containing sensor histidine kinase [Thiorhodovibrio frisius]EIC20426.1 PAS domain S-box [Thiorhodovibrio frisius]WPL21169.1 Autoinducer 2 sensor kinase/phosphatase LuxQ [Thiorhodovibrio frisius]
MQREQDDQIQDVANRSPWQWKTAALSAVVEHSDAIVVVKDLDLRVVAANAAFARVAGKPSVDALIGKTDAEIFDVSPESEPVRTYMADERAAQRLPAGEVIAREEPVIAHDGSLRFYLTKKHPIFDAQGTLLGTGNISVDITERHELEDQLRVSNTALTEAVTQAKAAVQVKSAFLARMSHEIRTPMNGILGLAELALRRSLDATTRQYLQELHQSGEQLLGILNDVLDQSKIESGQLSLEAVPFDREALFENERSLFAPMAQNKGLRLVSECDPAVPRWLLGDALRLRQVLSNLLSNAIKFTEHGEISLCLQCLEHKDNQVRLRWSVSDTGIGMDSDTQARLFQPFTQGDDSIARRFGGTGLGLSISRHLVERMGGRLDVESAPGVGSRFSFEVCLASVEPPVEFQASVASNDPSAVLNLRGRRILVAEDQPINQHIITDMLRLLGTEVTLAQNGREALEQLAKDDFDLVLMDIQMPEMDGLTATEQLRTNPVWAKLPVVALTAGVTTAERERTRSAGLSDLLAKPVRLKELQSMLSRWLPPVVGTQAAAPAPIPPAPELLERAATAPTETDPATVLAKPDLDLNYLCEIFDDRAAINEFLCDFVVSVRDYVDFVATALSEDNPSEARAMAHRLRGAAANVGAFALSRAAEHMEMALDPGAEQPSNGQIDSRLDNRLDDRLDRQLTELRAVWDRTLAQINQAAGCH